MEWWIRGDSNEPDGSQIGRCLTIQTSPQTLHILSQKDWPNQSQKDSWNPNFQPTYAQFALVGIMGNKFHARRRDVQSTSTCPSTCYVQHVDGQRQILPIMPFPITWEKLDFPGSSGTVWDSHESSLRPSSYHIRLIPWILWSYKYEANFSMRTLRISELSTNRCESLCGLFTNLSLVNFSQWNYLLSLFMF